MKNFFYIIIILLFFQLSICTKVPNHLIIKFATDNANKPIKIKAVSFAAIIREDQNGQKNSAYTVKNIMEFSPAN